jgi:hypothetical protein
MRVVIKKRRPAEGEEEPVAEYREAVVSYI